MINEPTSDELALKNRLEVKEPIHKSNTYNLVNMDLNGI